MELAIFLLIILIGVVFIIMVRNRIVRYLNATQRAWADVATYERQKLKVLDELMPLVEQYSSFEQDTMQKVTELRQQILNLNIKQTDVAQLQKVEALTQEMMRGLNVVVENYPELKANEIYLRMMNEIDDQNDNVSASISIFNRNVEQFNNCIQVFPNNMINGMTVGKKTIRPFNDSRAQKSFDYTPNFN